MTDVMWTDARIERLKELQADGKLSASGMATSLGGVTRNAIISKLARLGLRCTSQQKGGGRGRQVVPRAAPSNVTRGSDAGRPKAAKRGSHNGFMTRVAQGLPIKQTAPTAIYRENLPDVAPEPIQATRVTLMQLTDKHCRWPCWGDGDPVKFYCGGVPAHEQPYCRFHCARAFTSPRGRA